MTTLIAAGDSFTWGNDLSDCNQHTASNFSWSAIIADRLGYDYKCVAIPGGSNQSIERNVIEAVEQLTDVFVAVMWTYPHRLEYKLRQALDNTNYFTISGWHSFSIKDKLKNWGEISEGTKIFVERQHIEFEKVGIPAISKVTTDFLHDDQYYIDTLRSQILLKDYLETRKIPYIFLPACDNVMLKNIRTDDSYVNLLKEISSHANWINEPLNGFVQWATNNNYKIGPTGHPMEPAHLAYAENYIMPKVNVGA